MGATPAASSYSYEQQQKLKTRARKKFSKKIGVKNGLKIRKLKLNIQHKDANSGVQKFILGVRTNHPTKVIMLVGTTGGGKTTLINAMVNFIYGVTFQDKFRLEVSDNDNANKKSDAESQTDLITAYEFCYLPGMPFVYNYVLIDTPGFGDTRGIQRDREMMQQLESFLQQDYGVDQVDAVGLVTPSPIARLTHTQRYVFDGLSAMFGKDIKDHIYIMVTFADCQTPPVLEALQLAGIMFSSFFKFNNSALYASPQSDTDDSDNDNDANNMSKLFWEMGFKSLLNFFIKLHKTFPVSLTLTREVLEERDRLQVAVIGLQNQVQLGLGKVANLQQEKRMLARLDDDMKGNANYQIEKKVPKIKHIKLNKNVYVTNCNICNMTCHLGCIYPNNIDKHKCYAMIDGHCRICPEKCPWDQHGNEDFCYEITWTKEMHTVQDVLDRYQTAKKGKADKEFVIKAIEYDINVNTHNLLQLIQEAQQRVQRLEQIALRPNPLSTLEYIDLMIMSEKMQMIDNFQQRIELLEKLKVEAAMLQSIKDVKTDNVSGASGEVLLQHFQNLTID